MYVLYCIVCSYYVWPCSALCYIDLHCIALCVLLYHDLVCCTIRTFCTYILYPFTVLDYVRTYVRTLYVELCCVVMNCYNLCCAVLYCAVLVAMCCVKLGMLFAASTPRPTDYCPVPTLLSA